MADVPANEILQFKSAAEWERWLARNHSRSNGIWLRLFRKGSEVRSVKGAEALDAALCYGWITGQARADEISTLWRFCPRRPGSLWSRVNTMHIERLTKEGRMKPSGIRAVEEAKKDGRWERAYHPPSTAVLPADLMEKMRRNRKVRSFFETLNKTNRYAIIFRIETTKDPEKRKKRIDEVIRRLEEGRKFH
jgi:uncharacterized protein YdeI (YjbR/CyaY-like superfamily)